MIPPRILTRTLVALATGVGAAVPAGAVDLVHPHSSAFVSLYRCDSNRWIAVAYPAPFARSAEPLRLSWRGETVLLAPARSASGARYANRTSDVEWRVKEREARLVRASDGSTLVSGCVET